MLSNVGKSVMSMFSPTGGAKVAPSSATGPMAAALPQNMGATGEPPKAPGAEGNAPGSQQLENPTAPKSPLDDFSKLWDHPVVDPKAPKPVTAESMLEFDPAKLSEISRRLDFTKGLDPEILKKAQAGDAASFAAVLNYTTQNSFAQAMHAMSGVAKQALKKQHDTLVSNMPGEIRKANTRNELAATNPLYSHPATQPMINALEAQLRTKNPDATPQQITEHVKKYFDGVVSLAKGKDEGKDEGRTQFGSDNVNWDEFFGLDEQQAQ